MCIDRPHSRFLSRRRQRGMTLVELVVFIVVVSIGVAGVIGALSLSTRVSANPMLLKQQVAIAESLLEEVESKPFTWCDPDDAKVSTASAYTGCTTQQGLAHASDEDRYSQTTPYDNVGDYAGFAMSGIKKPSDSTNNVAGLAAYNASVAVSYAGTALGLSDNTAALKIAVTVSTSGQADFVLTGYRLRHAPNSP